MCDMYVPVLCVLAICPHLNYICVLTFYLFLLSLLLCPPPRGRWISQVLFTCSNFI